MLGRYCAEPPGDSIARISRHPPPAETPNRGSISTQFDPRRCSSAVWHRLKPIGLSEWFASRAISVSPGLSIALSSWNETSTCSGDVSSHEAITSAVNVTAVDRKDRTKHLPIPQQRTIFLQSDPLCAPVLPVPLCATRWPRSPH